MNNTILLFDFVAGPAHDLSVYRTASALIGMMLMVYGLVWDTD